MKRLFTSEVPVDGGVYRPVGEVCAESESESEFCKACLGRDTVGLITAPGCDRSTWDPEQEAWQHNPFPTRDNEYGALPTAFAGDTDIDTYGFDSRFEGISPHPTDPICPDPPPVLAYPDLWSLLSPSHQVDVLEGDCYCLGVGPERPLLSLGRPQFPTLPLVPFFTFPSFNVSGMTVREVNVDGTSVKGDCCPDEDDDVEYIHAEIVNGELRLTRHKKEDDGRRVYRADDTNTAFQVVAGFPKECCLLDDCGGNSNSSSGIEVGTEYVMRDLHFPRWPGPNSIVENLDKDGVPVVREARDPYGPGDLSSLEEPLGIIPVVVDVQCGDDGCLYVHHANIIVHDGHIAGLQWDTQPPRAISGYDPKLPPTPPEDLPVNKDYQDSDVIVPFTPLGELCDINCNTAAVLMGKGDQICIPDHPSDEFLCYVNEVSFVEVYQHQSQSTAEATAFDNAITATPSYCTATVQYFLSYSIFNETAQLYEAAVKYCCPVP